MRSSLGEAFITLFQLLTMDGWFRLQSDISTVVPVPIVVLFFISWVWIGAFIFRNIFIGVMGTPCFCTALCFVLVFNVPSFVVVKNFETIADELHARVRKEDRERLMRQKKAKLETALQTLAAPSGATGTNRRGRSVNRLLPGVRLARESNEYVSACCSKIL